MYRRDRIPLDEAAPVAVAERVADVDDHRQIVDRAAADERDEPGVGTDRLESARRLVAARVPEPLPVVVAQEVPAVEKFDVADGVTLPNGLHVAEAAEEAEVKTIRLNLADCWPENVEAVA